MSPETKKRGGKRYVLPEVKTERKMKNTFAIDLAKYKNLQAAISITNASSASSSNENILSDI